MQRVQNKTTVLIAEVDGDLRSFLLSTLEAYGYRTLTAENGGSVLSMVSSHCPDLVLLSLDLPDKDGFEVLGAIRRRSEVPIVVLSSGTDENAVVRALDMGADDCIAQPFRPPEFLARVRAALRHGARMGAASGPAEEKLTCGDLTVDFAQRLVTVGGKPVHLTQNEFKIVLLLARHPGEVLSYSYILEHVWGNFAADDRQILRVNMANIRRKIERDPAEPCYLLTEVGVGYRMADHPLP